MPARADGQDEVCGQRRRAKSRGADKHESPVSRASEVGRAFLPWKRAPLQILGNLAVRVQPPRAAAIGNDLRSLTRAHTVRFDDRVASLQVAF